MLGLGLPALAVWQALKGWLPSRLFSAGEAGGLWDFTTLANLYQDSAGTSPVTSVGQTIGLVLDTKNGPPVLGPELVTNGDFSNGTTGWTSGSTGTIEVVSGVLRVNNSSGGGYNRAKQDITSTAAGWRYISFTTSGSSPILSIASSSGGGSANISASSFYYHTGGFLTLSAYCNTSTLGVWAGFDNISVRELPGNHLTQSTSTKRPLLGRMPAGGVRNLLTQSDGFSNATITGAGLVVMATGLPASDGTLTARQIRNTTTTEQHRLYQRTPITGANTFYIDVKNVDAGYVQLSSSGTVVATFSATFDLVAGTYTTSSNGQQPTASMELINGFYRCKLHAPASETGICSNQQFYILESETSLSNPFTTGTEKSVIVGAAQIEPGSTATAYQRVTTANDITESGVADVYCAYFDGVDDCLVSPSIDFSATDKMTFWAGYRKANSASSEEALVEIGVAGVDALATSVSVNTNSGTGKTNRVVLRDATNSNLTHMEEAMDIGVYIWTASMDRSSMLANEVSNRINGVAVSNSVSGASVTGNFGNDPLYVGQRGASSLPYKGFMTALSARGATTDADTIVKMEKWLAARTPGVNLP